MDVAPDVGVDAAEAQHEIEALQVGRFLLRRADGKEEGEASLGAARGAGGGWVVDGWWGAEGGGQAKVCDVSDSLA